MACIGKSLVAQSGKNVDVPPFGDPPNPPVSFLNTRCISGWIPDCFLNSAPDREKGVSVGMRVHTKSVVRARLRVSFSVKRGSHRLPGISVRIQGQTEEVKFAPVGVVVPVRMEQERGK